MTRKNAVSMTGYGKGEGASKRVAITIELKSVNSRYLDLLFKMPRQYNPVENELRELIGGSIFRGRVEIFVNRNELEMSEDSLNFNEGIFNSYYEIYKTAYRSLGKQISSEAEDKVVLELLSKREILETQPNTDLDSDEVVLIRKTLKVALNNLLAMKAIEGKKLEEDILGRLAKLSNIKDKIEASVKNVKDEYLGQLREKIKSLLVDVTVDETRLMNEVAYMVDKVDVTEELVRIESHLKQFSESLKNNAGGRKLDFLMQELGREFNTITSKTIQSEVQSEVIEAKAEMEKIREQVQNIE